MSSAKTDKKLNYDVDGFSTYLAESKSISTLLFWKECEDYTTLFGVQERAKTAEKIYERYIMEGAEFEVASKDAAVVNSIKAQLANPPEELFVELQQEAYNSMLFELFPAFWEQIKKQDAESNTSRQSNITADTTLAQIIKANDLEVHLFAEYCREHMCEESVTFLLECGMFALLFDPVDLETQAKRIYDLYLDEKSEGRISGISDHFINNIKKTLETANILHMDSKALRKSSRHDSAGTGVTTALFQRAVDEVMQTLNMDVWPRYKDAVLSKGALTLRTSSTKKKESAEPTEGGRPTKAAVKAVLKNPVKLPHLREAAQAQGMLESVNFCAEAIEYSLLFSEADRKPRVKVLWDTYMSPGADLPINVPDTMIRDVEMKKDNTTPDLFDNCVQELLQLIADNIYNDYQKIVSKKEKEDAAAAAPAPAPAAAPPPPNSGGCGCVLL